MVADSGREHRGDVVGVVLAAGAGTRLAPLSRLRPKPLCPVGGVPLVDLAVERAGSAGVGDVAVNVHHGREAMEAHLAGRDVHVSIEEREALGTAGALGRLRDWIAGAAALVLNADAWCPGSLSPFLAGWDGERVRLLLVGTPTLEPTSQVAAALMPWSVVEHLAPQPSGLYETSWRPAQAAGRLEVVAHDRPFVDCGTPAQYLAANLQSSGGASVIGEGAVVEGRLDRCVVWDGARVEPSEELSCAVRTDRAVTVLVR
ncbi:MAG TPA: sugar phosphate nucleotidyltransferase [Acidimicrobiales bacterium]|nr:sugar phosphate nucleotidyltransferase [Acidimicrobiales bacterium]